MERLTDIINQNKPQQISSQIEVTEIPHEKQAAMGDVLDRWRLNEGWNPRDELTQSFEIRSYVISLNREGVPANAYQELYERAMKTRALAIQNGKQLPTFGVELLLAHWIGENGLAKERRDKIAADRQLNPECVQVCPLCFDTGKQVYPPNRGEDCPDCKSQEAAA